MWCIVRGTCEGNHGLSPTEREYERGDNGISPFSRLHQLLRMGISTSAAAGRSRGSLAESRRVATRGTQVADGGVETNGWQRFQERLGRPRQVLRTRERPRPSRAGRGWRLHVAKYQIRRNSASGACLVVTPRYFETGERHPQRV